MGCDLYAGTPAVHAARLSLPSVDPRALAALTRIAAEERGVDAPEIDPLPPAGELGEAWTDLFAGAGEAAARRIGQRWLREIDPEAAAVPEAIDSAAGLIRSIVDLCRAARADHLPVVCAPG